MSVAPRIGRRVRSAVRVPLVGAALALAGCGRTDPGTRSWLVGTSALSGLLLVAGLLTLLRPLRTPSAADRRGVRVAGAVAVALQAGHAAEEYLTGFWDAFPRMLGLPPWSARAFLVFNAAWLLVWGGALVGVGRGWRAAAWPLWFLALALVANGVAHPLLALVRGTYFPGLVTAPVVAIAGLFLLRALTRASAESAPAAATGGAR